jgi:hypothetical protein
LEESSAGERGMEGGQGPTSGCCAIEEEVQSLNIYNLNKYNYYVFGHYPLVRTMDSFQRK